MITIENKPLFSIRLFGQEVLRSRRHATTYALLFCCLPFLSWVASVILGLVTLLNGAKEGALLAIVISLPITVIACFKPVPLIVLAMAISGHVIVWVLSIVLCRTQSWSRVLSVATCLGVVAVLVLHLFYPDLTVIWVQKLKEEWAFLEQQANVEVPLLNVGIVAQYATGLQLCALMMGSLLNLLLARGWQATIYNPGGLSKELQSFSLEKLTAVGCILCAAAGFGLGLAGFKDGSAVIALPCFLVGLNIVHRELVQKSIAILVLFYVALIWFFITIASLLVLVGLLDSFINLRQLKERY